MQADARQADGIANITEEPERRRDPPQATLTRRAQSYSDFYDAMTAQLGKETGICKEERYPVVDIKSELDFGTWFHTIEDDLLSVSHEEYQYAYCPLSGRHTTYGTGLC